MATALGLALASLGLTDPRPVLILVGGAANLDEGVATRLRPLFQDLVPVLDRLGAAVIDGGSRFGVMALMGEARQRGGGSFPLIGIAPRGRVNEPESCLPGPDGAVFRVPPVVTTNTSILSRSDAARCRADHLPADRAADQAVDRADDVPRVRLKNTVPIRMDDEPRVALDPHHSHFLLVPGGRWGDESPWLMAAAERLAGGRETLLLVAGGGEVTRHDVQQRLNQGGRVLALAGSGGTADALVAWRGGEGPPPLDDPGVFDPALVEVLDLFTAGDRLPGLLAQTFAN